MAVMSAAVGALDGKLKLEVAGLTSVWDFLANIKGYVVDALVAIAQSMGLDKAGIRAFVMDQWNGLWISTIKPWADALNPMTGTLENMLDSAVKAIADRLINSILNGILGA